MFAGDRKKLNKVKGLHAFLPNEKAKAFLGTAKQVLLNERSVIIFPRL